MPTIDDLKVYRGMPVPWVARWTGERPRPLVQAEIDPVTHLIHWIHIVGAERDADGVLWQPDGQSMTGTPEFGEVNALRQRDAMVNRMCQVCGSKIETDVTHVLVIEAEAQTWDVWSRHKREVTSTTPPVCEACVEVATTTCPALGQGFRLAVVESYEYDRLFGVLYVHADSLKVGGTRTMDVMLSQKKHLQSFVAKQAIWKLGAWSWQQ